MKKIIAVALALTPVVAFAQLTQITDVNSLSSRLVSLGNTFTYLLIALAVIFIIWNVVMSLIKGNDPAARGAAASSILYGIVGLFVILSIWGLVNILVNTFGTRPPAATVPQAQNAPIVY
ncbi:MAG: hypothetical protein WCP09_01045 [Candidatus Taylorbacteria bacterium]